jgi:1-acyl-sn-glycerol-3-phosphate acyltransferase
MERTMAILTGGGLLAGVAVLAAAVAVWRITRASQLRPVQACLWLGAYLLCRCLWRARWHGQLALPEHEGAVIVCNHRSSVDPFFLQTTTLRKTHWMVAREYCELPVLGWLLATCEVIPVRRGAIDLAATRTAIRLAASGELVGMLPEGRINQTEQFMLPVRPGAALVALKARVKVVPCYVQGAPYWRCVFSPFFLPARVEVWIGQPLDFSPYYGREHEPDVLKEVTRRIVQEIARLAGRPDFEPQFAGRHWKGGDEGVLPPDRPPHPQAAWPHGAVPAAPEALPPQAPPGRSNVSPPA